MTFPAVTARCEREDLLKLVAVGSATLVEHFIKRRSIEPEPDERLKISGMGSPHYSLHSGRLRGATWYDSADDIVWLVAAGMHRSGERGDAYPYVLELEKKGHLAPTEDDRIATRAHREAAARVQPLVATAHALRALRGELLKDPSLGRLGYAGPDGLFAQVWVKEVIEEAAMIRVRVKLRLQSGRFLNDQDLAIVVRGPLGDTAYESPDQDHGFRCFEDVLSRFA